ncbi:MAG: hypothetical protein Q4C77_18580 [Eubacteriales bacterium]|nr:hypothetical protein [Eubacteriales bacterium]
MDFITIGVISIFGIIGLVMSVLEKKGITKPVLSEDVKNLVSLESESF